MSEKSKKLYNKRMNHYDDVLTARKWWSRLYMSFLWKVDIDMVADEVLKMIPDNLSGELLDVPIGTAVFTYKKYLKMPHVKVIGLDYSCKMLGFAQNKIELHNIKNVQLIQGDVGNLPFAGNRFDMILSMNGFHAFSDKERAFDETYRVLKPNGVFCGCFYIKSECSAVDWWVRHVLDRKGFFIPPHYNFDGVKQTLQKRYGKKIALKKNRSILFFRCEK